MVIIKGFSYNYIDLNIMIIIKHLPYINNLFHHKQFHITYIQPTNAGKENDSDYFQFLASGPQPRHIRL